MAQVCVKAYTAIRNGKPVKVKAYCYNKDVSNATFSKLRSDRDVQGRDVFKERKGVVRKQSATKKTAIYKARAVRKEKRETGLDKWIKAPSVSRIKKAIKKSRKAQSFLPKRKDIKALSRYNKRRFSDTKDLLRRRK